MSEVDDIYRMTVEEALQRIACVFHSQTTSGRVRAALADGVEVQFSVRIKKGEASDGFKVTFSQSEVRHRNVMLDLNKCP